MDIINDLKLLIGYTGTNLDWLFAVLAMYIVMMFITILFGIFKSAIGISRH